KLISDVEEAVRGDRRARLRLALRDRPFARGAVDRDRRPALALLARHVDEERVPVVLDAYAVLGHVLLLESADVAALPLEADEARPAASLRFRSRDALAVAVGHLVLRSLVDRVRPRPEARVAGFEEVLQRLLVVRRDAVAEERGPLRLRVALAP